VAPELNSLLIKIDSGFWLGQVTNRIFDTIQDICLKSCKETRIFVIKRAISDCKLVKISNGIKNTCNIYGI
jgi:hypothetical protein